MTQDPTGARRPAARLEPVRLEGFDGAERFGVWWWPERHPPRGAILCVQPLGAERANARRTLAGQAWRLATRGWAVLMVDLHGCGDSPGDPADATLEGWRSDLLRAAMLARQRHAGPNVLWGIRHGALLAADIAVALDQLVDGYVFWQAPESGRDLAQAPGEGGMLSEALRADLCDLPMHPPPVAEHGTPPSVIFVDFVDAGGRRGEPSAVASRLTEAWLGAGYLAELQVVHGARFWLPGDERSRTAPAGPDGSPTSGAIATERFLKGLE